jgi:hypothetical protein
LCTLIVTTPKGDSARGAVTPTPGVLPACIRCVAHRILGIGWGYVARILFGRLIAEEAWTAFS